MKTLEIFNNVGGDFLVDTSIDAFGEKRIMVPTSNFEMIRKWVDYSLKNKTLAMIIGENGYGKTDGLQFAIRNIPNAVYIRVGVGEPAKVFYARFLSMIMGMKTINPDFLNEDSNIHYLMEKASFIINSRADIDLIIVDEFGNFNSKYVPYIRQIWDDVKHHCGMVLAGPPSIYQDLKRWQRERRPGINELISRTGPRKVELKPHTLGDAKLIANSRHIIDQNQINFLFRNSPDLRIMHAYIDDFKAGFNNLR